jgi:hypothetical protein
MNSAIPTVAGGKRMIFTRGSEKAGRHGPIPRFQGLVLFQDPVSVCTLMTRFNTLTLRFNMSGYYDDPPLDVAIHLA